MLSSPYLISRGARAPFAPLVPPPMSHMHSRIPWQVCSREQIRPLYSRKAGDVLVMDLWAVYPVRIFNNIVDSGLYRAIIQDNAGVRAFRTHRSDLLEAFTNPSTPANLSAETAAQLSDETRKKYWG